MKISIVLTYRMKIHNEEESIICVLQNIAWNEQGNFTTVCVNGDILSFLGKVVTSGVLRK